MTISVPDQTAFSVHVSAYELDGQPATEAGAWAITASNPDMVVIDADPARPGDTSWALVTPITATGQFVLNALDTTTLYAGGSEELSIDSESPAIGSIEIAAVAH